MTEYRYMLWYILGHTHDEVWVMPPFKLMIFITIFNALFKLCSILDKDFTGLVLVYLTIIDY